MLRIVINSMTMNREDRPDPYSIAAYKPVDFDNQFDPVTPGGNAVLQGSIARTSTGYGKTATVKAGEDLRPALESLRSAGGGTLILLEGVHNVNYDIEMFNNLKIVGAGVDLTIIDFNSANYQMIGDVSISQLELAAFTVQGSSDDEAILIRGSSNNNIIFSNISVADNTNIGIRSIGGIVNFLCNNILLDNNGSHGISLVNGEITGGNLINCFSRSNDGAGFYFDGNQDITVVGCTAQSNGVNGFDCRNTDGNIVFLGCKASVNTGDGFYLTVGSAILLGCNATALSSNGLYSIDYTKRNLLGFNNNLAAVDKRDQAFMLNTSGSTINIGSVVVFKPSADGDEITTTTTAGDDYVFGVVIGVNLSNNSRGTILTEGKTTQLKVNGVTDIAIGDFLCTYTTAGIAAKAGSGDMAFAIALEAYTNNDSNGVIDALVIKPRKL